MDKISIIQNEHAMDALSAFLTSKLDFETGPAKLYFALTDEERASLPIVGSDKGNNPEYTWLKSTTGKGKDKKISAFDTLFANTPAGSKLTSEIEKRKAKPGQKVGASTLSQIKTLRNQRSAGAQVIKLVAAVHQNYVAVNETDGLVVTWLLNADKETPARTKYPIKVRGNADEDDVVFAMSAFAKLDMSKYEKAEGKTPLEKLKHCRAGSGTDDATKGKPVKNADDFINTALGLANFIDDEDKFETLKKLEDKTDLESVAALVESVNDLAKALGPKLKGFLKAAA